LPKEKQPPENIWDNNTEITRWFDRVFDRNDSSKNDSFVLTINDVEG